MNMKSNLSSFFALKSMSALWAFVLLMALFSPSDAWAQSSPRSVVSYEGYGEAKIEEGADIAVARTRAFDHAVLDAFEKALRDLCPADTPLEQQEKAIQNLVPEVKSYLLRYRVISEMPTQAAYFLSLEASFSSKAVKEALARVLGDGTQTRKLEGTTGAVMMRVSGITSPQLYRELMTFLRSRVPGVRSVLPLEVFGNSALLRVNSELDAENLAASVRQWDPEGFSLRVESGSGQMALVLTPSPHADTEPLFGSGTSEESP